MLTFEDCVGLCGLSAEEIAAIARHEHLPEIVALELGASLARQVSRRRAAAAGADQSARARHDARQRAAPERRQLLQHV